VTVAELVPEIAVLECASVAVPRERFSSDRFQQLQVRGERLVPTGYESVDRPQSAICGDHEIRPPCSGADGSVVRRDGFQGADDSRSDCDDVPAPTAHGVDQPGRCLRDLVLLGVRRLVALRGGHPGMQRQRRDQRARGSQAAEELERERPAVEMRCLMLKVQVSLKSRENRAFLGACQIC